MNTEGKAGSVAMSKGSAGSGMSESRAQVLRRGIQAQGRRLEGTLVSMSAAIIVVFVLTGLMNIAACILTQVLFTELQGNMQLVTWNGDRGIYLTSSYTQVRFFAWA
jgi:hypothetical protein